MVFRIHQIYYSEATRSANDKGFLGLNNLPNERPDWREYWPIRKYLTENQLNNRDYYGFFSPKFGAKTNLKSSDVFEFVNSYSADAYIFSPFFDQSAYYLNVYEQGIAHHPELLPIFQEILKIFDPNKELVEIITDSRNTVFCNYIVANSRFWNEWFRCCEVIFQLAEEKTTLLGNNLNLNTGHAGDFVPAKVFIIERLATFVVATHNIKTKAYDAMLLPYTNLPISNFKLELCQLDALKIAYSETSSLKYLNAYKEIKLKISEQLLSRNTLES